MLRHACGFALANKGHDTRALQAYLGHRNIQHTVRYTELAPDRFKDSGGIDPVPDRQVSRCARKSDGVLGERSTMVLENLTTEGEPPKRYRMVYWGEIVGGWDTA